jgi:hypothetical protein
MVVKNSEYVAVIKKIETVIQAHDLTNEEVLVILEMMKTRLMFRALKDFGVLGMDIGGQK